MCGEVIGVFLYAKFAGKADFKGFYTDKRSITNPVCAALYRGCRAKSPA